jgi:hypothetical protein
VFSRATPVEQTASEIVCDIDIVDDLGHPVAAIRGMRCRRIRAGGSAATSAAPGLYREHWVELAGGEGLSSQRQANGRSYLVLGAGGRVAHELAAELRLRGARVISSEPESADRPTTTVEALLAAEPVDEIVVVMTLAEKRAHAPAPDPAVIADLVALLQLAARTRPHPSITIFAEGAAQ